jgi:beta-N-acetylhexosaminidase
MPAAFITGLAGLELARHEAELLRAARPCGVILFARNVREPEQVRRLTSAVRAALGDEEALILIDQEGGRVQRLVPPRWRLLPPAAAYARAFAGDVAAAARAAGLVARLTAADLRAVGINTNCAPLLDVPVAGSHGIIGDRAYASVPADVAALGRAVSEGLMAGGVLPVIKHLPGHGRATRDSHLELPVVTASRSELEGSDFVPFRALAAVPAGMTAHVVFTSFDGSGPASTSQQLIAEAIRGAIGFDGLLLSDDLAMRALSGSVSERARAVLAAGCDLALACSGTCEEIEAVAGVAPALAGAARTRCERARAVFGQQQPFDVVGAEAARAAVCLRHAESV